MRLIDLYPIVIFLLSRIYFLVCYLFMFIFIIYDAVEKAMVYPNKTCSIIARCLLRLDNCPNDHI